MKRTLVKWAINGAAAFFAILVSIVMFGLSFRLLDFIGIPIKLNEMFFIGCAAMLLFATAWIWHLDGELKRRERIHKAEVDYQDALIQSLRNDRRRIPKAKVLKLDFVRKQAH